MTVMYQAGWCHRAGGQAGRQAGGCQLCVFEALAMQPLASGGRQQSPRRASLGACLGAPGRERRAGWRGLQEGAPLAAPAWFKCRPLPSQLKLALPWVVPGVSALLPLLPCRCQCPGVPPPLSPPPPPPLLCLSAPRLCR